MKAQKSTNVLNVLVGELEEATEREQRNNLRVQEAKTMDELPAVGLKPVGSIDIIPPSKPRPATIQKNRCKGNGRRGTGTIYKQPGCSTWTIQFYRNGKRVREATGFSDYRAAQQKLTHRLNQVNKGEPIPIGRKRLPVKELYEGLERHYRINGRRSLAALGYRWKHLGGFFADMPAISVTKEMIERYVDQRLGEGARPATVNREMASLKTAFHLAADQLPRLPAFPAQLKENNVRTGFLEDHDYTRLTENVSELWLRTFLELDYTFGWRREEILGLRVRQVDLRSRSIRLEVGTTKTDEGREVPMTEQIYQLVKESIAGKSPDDFLFTRDGNKPIGDFRKRWRNLCIKAGLGRMLCRTCQKTVIGSKCVREPCP